MIHETHRLHQPPPDSYPARLLRAFLSAVISGLGQLLAGVRRRGFFLLAIFAVVTLAAIIILTRGLDAIVGWAVQPSVLLAFLFVDIMVMLTRVFAVIDAWLTAKAGSLNPVHPSGPGKVIAGVGLVLVLVLTVAPHAVAGYYTLVSRNLITTVFAQTTATTQPTSSSNGASGGNSGSQSTQTGGSTAPLDLGSNGRITVLLIGSDADSTAVTYLDALTGPRPSEGQRPGFHN